MLKSLLTNFFNRYLLSATSVTDVVIGVLNLSVNITENIPIEWRLHLLEREESKPTKKYKKKSKLYSTLESAKGKKKWRERG